MPGRIISIDQKDIWSACLKSAAANYVPGPSFDQNYAALYVGENDNLEAFSFEDLGFSYFLPYVRRSVRSDLFPGDAISVIESPYGYAGIIASTEDHGFLSHAWEQFELRMMQANVIAAFLRFDPLLQTQRYFAGPPECLVSIRDVVTPTLSTNEEVLLGGCKGNVRNKINKARRCGVKVRVSETVEQAMSFVPLYQETMSRLLAKDFYQFGPTYFKKLFCRSDTTCLIAELEGKQIAGIIGVRYGDNAIVHLSATNEIARTNGASQLLRYELMLSMAQLGCKKFNFGGGKTDHKKDNLLAHKKGFSNETERFYIAKCMINPAKHLEVTENWLHSPYYDADRAKYFIPYAN